MITEKQKEITDKLESAIMALEPLLKEAFDINVGTEISILNNGKIGIRFFSKREEIKNCGVFLEFQ